MKKDAVSKLYSKVFGYNVDGGGLNKTVKAIILDFGDREVTVANDNFGTRRKYMDFTNGRAAAGLNPAQVVFGGLEIEQCCHTKYIGADGKIYQF